MFALPPRYVGTRVLDASKRASREGPRQHDFGIRLAPIDSHPRCRPRHHRDRPLGLLRRPDRRVKSCDHIPRRCAAAQFFEPVENFSANVC
jgi:hypothetical protein